MSAKPRKAVQKDKVLAFKVEQPLFDLLNKLPNKSEFIRRAIVAQLGMSCPLCNGKGIVSQGIHQHFKPVLESHRSRNCQRCGVPQTFSLESANLPEEDQDRLEQFYLGGPMYCADCFERMPSCDDCGWHIAPELAAEHHRKAHCHHE